MTFFVIEIFETRKQFLVVLFLSMLLFSPSWGDWTGAWEGSMESGSNRFRVAFVLSQSSGEYHNIDDGIHAEPLTIEIKQRNSLRASKRRVVEPWN